MDEASIFTAALEKESADERSAFLDEVCGNDTRLRAEVCELLAAHEGAECFPRKPAERLAAEIAGGANDTVGESPGQHLAHLQHLNPNVRSEFTPLKLPSRPLARIGIGLAIVGCLVLFTIAVIMVYVQTNAQGKDQLTEVRRFKGHTGKITGLEFFGDGRRAASASNDKTLRIWDVMTGEQLKLIDTGKPLLALALSPDEKVAAVAVGDPINIVELWDLESGERAAAFPTHPKGHDVELAEYLAFTPDGQRLVSADIRSHVRVWNLKTLQQERSFKTRVPDSTALSPRGDLLAAVVDEYTDFNRVQLWNIATGGKVGVLVTEGCGSTTFSNDGKLLATASSEIVQIWDVETREEIRRIPIPDAAYDKEAAAFDKDAAYKVAETAFKKAEAADKEDETALKEAETAAKASFIAAMPYLRSILSFRFTADDRALLIGSLHGKLGVWDVETGREVASVIATPRKLNNRFDKSSVSPDGRYVLTGGGVEFHQAYQDYDVYLFRLPESVWPGGNRNPAARRP